ncbi:MAG: methyltransferase [Bacteroidota bacterium]
MDVFHFKQFTIQQDNCAMKVGTDGVLLGAWTSLNCSPDTILDVGSGTGLIALMLAQRATASVIDAIEIDTDAFEQCVANFEASPWADRLFCYHAGFQEFYEEIEESYDLIVSNPPFFIEDVSSGQISRDRARQNQSLPYPSLFEGIKTLLAPKGELSMIIPYSAELAVLDLAATQGLYPSRITRVKGNPIASFKRSLLQLSRNKIAVTSRELVIELERHVYSKEYIQLTKDFYLKM